MTPDSTDTAVDAVTPAPDVDNDSGASAEPRTANEVLFTARTHAKLLVKPTLVGIAGIALMVAAGIYIPGDLADGWGWKAAEVALAILIIVYAIVPAIQWRFSRYTLTTTQMVAARGIIWRSRQTVPISRVAQIQTERGLLDRIFDCGTLIILDQSSSDPLYFRDIPQVLRVADQINELI